MTRGWRLVVVGETPKKFTPFSMETYARWEEATRALFEEMGATHVDTRFEDLDGNPRGRKLEPFP